MLLPFNSVAPAKKNAVDAGMGCGVNCMITPLGILQRNFDVLKKNSSRTSHGDKVFKMAVSNVFRNKKENAVDAGMGCGVNKADLTADSHSCYVLVLL